MQDPGEKDLEFVTIEGLLAYGEAMALRPSVAAGPQVEKTELPPRPLSPADRTQKSMAAKNAVRQLVSQAQNGFPSAEAYRAARQRLLKEACNSDALVFYAAWNQVLVEGDLGPLLRAPIGRVQKPTQRRPAAIVPRAHLTPQLLEGRIVLDLGNDRFWLLHRDLTGRTLLFTSRHGVSRWESRKYRVGRRLPNELAPEEGIAKADAVGTALARCSASSAASVIVCSCQPILIPANFPTASSEARIPGDCLS
jgi:6-phosphofructokinase 1